MISLYNGESL